MEFLELFRTPGTNTITEIYGITSGIHWNYWNYSVLVIKWNFELIGINSEIGIGITGVLEI